MRNKNLPSLVAIILFHLTAPTFGQAGIRSNVTELNRVTFAVGVGYSHLLDTPYDYYLTTDAQPKLKLQELNRSSIVISSIVSIKLSKVGKEQQTKNGVTKSVLVNLNATEDIPKTSTDRWMAVDGEEVTIAGSTVAVKTHKKTSFGQNLAFNIGINLVELQADNIAFNKSIDGGIGLGYYFNESVGLALFFDMIRIKQMRESVVSAYENQRIPNGNDFYNALDQNNNNLFYSKYFPGVSIKIVLSLGNKKS